MRTTATEALDVAPEVTSYNKVGGLVRRQGIHVLRAHAFSATRSYNGRMPGILKVPPEGATDEELRTKKILIRQHVLETDLHPFVAGVTFDEVWSRRLIDRLGDTPAAFACLDDLIRMKEAAGRPKDLEDLRYLRGLRDDNSQP